jgi:hypothetical protein
MAKVLDLVGLPGIGGMPAMTIGHVIWARNRREMRKWHRHEMIHVAQFERWGPLMVPAFYVFAVWLVLRGKHPYYDNPIELEAYGKVAFPHAVDGLPRPVPAIQPEVSPQVARTALKKRLRKTVLTKRLLPPSISPLRPATVTRT